MTFHVIIFKYEECQKIDTLKNFLRGESPLECFFVKKDFLLPRPWTASSQAFSVKTFRYKIYSQIWDGASNLSFDSFYSGKLSYKHGS